MNSKSKIKKCFIAVFAIFLLLPLATFAAELRIETKNQEIGVDEQFKVDVVLNARGEELNAIEGNILFPDNMIALKEIKDGNSVVSFWIERPRMTGDGKIEFSGIIPGGYKEANGLLFSVIFTAKTDGQGIVEFQNARVLKNDGLGTPASLTLSSFQFSISKDAQEIEVAETQDNEPPESFAPEIASDPALFDGKWFLVFVTQDKASGIDHYEVREGRWGKFVIAESPYLLQNQNLDSKIFVKAVDRDDNERIEILYPSNYKSWYQNYWIVVILVVMVIIVGAILRKILWQKSVKSR